MSVKEKDGALHRKMRNAYGRGIVAAVLMHLVIEPSWRVLIVPDPELKPLSSEWRERLDEHEGKLIQAAKRLLRPMLDEPEYGPVTLAVPEAKNIASLTLQEFAALDEWHLKGELPETYRNPTLVLLLTLHGYSLEGKEAVVVANCLWRPEEGLKSLFYLHLHRGQWEVAEQVFWQGEVENASIG